MKVLYLAIAYCDLIDIRRAIAEAFSYDESGHIVTADYEVDFQHGVTEDGDQPYLAQFGNLADNDQSFLDWMDQ